MRLRRPVSARWGIALAIWPLLLVVAGCASIEDQLSNLAAQPPLPYSVLVTGGAFLEVSAEADDDALARTFSAAAAVDGGAGGAPPEEAFPLSSIMEVLTRGRVFVRAALDPGPVAARRAIGDPSRGDDREAMTVLLDRARAEGHDLVLAIERLRDGPVARQGVNGRWPVTVLAWLSVGLGLFIPDHTYESSATLVFSLRDVQSGEVLVRGVRQAGVVDLSLVERSDVLGIVSSIVVPPPLVWDDDAEVVDKVRAVTERRLLVSLAGRLKGVATTQEIRAGQAVELEVAVDDGELAIRVAANEGLAGMRVRVDGRWLDDERTDALWGRLRASVRGASVRSTDELEYRCRWRPEGGGRIQVVVQTLSGRLASSTVDWGRR